MVLSQGWSALLPTRRGHWAVSGDICGCHDWGCSQYRGGGGRGAAPHPTPGWPPAENGPALMSAAPSIENPALEKIPSCKRDELKLHAS